MDLLHAMSLGIISDIGLQEKSDDGIVNVFNSRVGLLSVMSVRFDVDMEKRTGAGRGDEMNLARFANTMKTFLKSFSLSNYQGQDKVQVPAMALVDENGNQIGTDPHKLHVEYSGTITINGGGTIDAIDQEIIPAVQADKRLSIHSIYISISSVEGTISLDFAGADANNVFKFFCEDGPMDDIQKHSVSALAESLKMTGDGLSPGETIYYSIQAVAE